MKLLLIDNIISLAANFLLGFFDKFPSFSIALNYEILESFVSYVALCAYFVPLDTVLAIFAIIVMEELFKIGLSLLKLVWRFIPIFGN